MNHHDELTTRLTRQLHDQADGLHGAPLSFETVRGRARTIRRNRRLAASTAAALAVAAIALPTALLGDGTGRSDGPPPITNTPTQGVAPTPRADGTFPLTIDAPEGAVPSHGYLDGPGKRLVLPDGDRDLAANYLQLQRFGDGWLGLESGSYEDIGSRLVRLDADMDVVEDLGLSNSLVVTPDGSRAAWVVVNDDSGSLVQATPDGETARTEVERTATLAGRLSDDRLVLQFQDLENGGATYDVVGPDGSTTPFDGRLNVRGADATANRVTVLSEYGAESCFAVLDVTSSEFDAETCDFGLGAFSPDGSYVVGTTAGDDGLGSPQLAVLDAATLEPVVEWSAAPRDRSPAYVSQVVWEDDDTLVATVTEGTEQVVMRAELDGALERVSEPAEVQMSIAYQLPDAILNLS